MLQKILIKNFWLKMFALLLAFVIWLYVVAELNKGTPEQKTFFGMILPTRVTAKEVPIKITLVGKPLSRYRILNDRMSVKPSSCLILAPKYLAQNIDYVATQEIDANELTKSVVKQVKIKPMGPGIILEKDFYVTVVIPVERVE